MDLQAVSACRSCGAPIMWAITEAGSPIPLDAIPDPQRGNIEVHEDGSCRVLGDLERLLIVEVDGDAAELYLSHFASCPHAGEWRSRGGRAA